MTPQPELIAATVLYWGLVIGAIIALAGLGTIALVIADIASNTGKHDGDHDV